MLFERTYPVDYLYSMFSAFLSLLGLPISTEICSNLSHFKKENKNNSGSRKITVSPSNQSQTLKETAGYMDSTSHWLFSVVSAGSPPPRLSGLCQGPTGLCSVKSRGGGGAFIYCWHSSSVIFSLAEHPLLFWYSLPLAPRTLFSPHSCRPPPPNQSSSSSITWLSSAPSLSLDEAPFSHVTCSLSYWCPRYSLLYSPAEILVLSSAGSVFSIHT